MNSMHSAAGKTLRMILACGAGTAALTWGGAAFAQDAAPTDDAIIVTGSRLITTGMDTPVPVTAVQAEELENMDPTSLIASVGQLPQFYNNTTPNNSNFFVRAGTGNLNLRGLGVNRTLTLLNGRRFPSNSAFGGVDINVFPEAMIKGIETVTGGASAAYGTDAVAGVVNFILDTDFTGLQVDLQGGITSRGDNKNWEGKIAWGTNLGDRGHLLVSASRAEGDGIHNWDGRDWYQSVGAMQIAGVWTDFPNMHSSNSSFDGIISSTNPLLNGLKFDRNGNTSPFVLGSPSTGGVGTSNARTVGGDGDDLGNEVFTIWPDTDRYSVFAYADYDLSDNFSIFGQYVRGYNHQFQYNTPRGFLQGNPQGLVTIFADNAFLPQNISDIMANNNIASFNLRRLGSIEDIGQSFFEDKITQDVGTVGFNGELSHDGFLGGWKFDGFYQYGRSRRVWDQYALRMDRIYAALDAVDDGHGNIVCRVSLDPEGAAAFPGCKPINLFGRGNASPEAIDYVLGNDPGVHITTPLYFANLGFTGETLDYTTSDVKRNITTFKQQLAEFSIRGDVFDNWAGKVSLALGGSWRRESIYQVVQDQANQASDFSGAFHPVRCNDASLGLRGVNQADCLNTVAHQFSKVSNVQGAISVEEAFGELYFPLISDQPWMQSASLNAAGRWAHYSGAGTVWAYKAGLDLTVSDAFRLRGTYSRDVRAGNLSETFDKTGGAGTAVDPRITATDIANCQALANPALNCSASIPVTVFSGGNPAIKPEKADTFTAGVVVQPGFLPGFSASLDWYQVKIDGAISQLTTNEVARRCIAEQDQQFCDLITFEGVTDAGAYPKMVIVGNQYVNVAQSKVEGIDVELAYRSQLKLFGGEESIAARIFGSYLIERSDTAAPTGVNPNPIPTRVDGITGLAPDTAAQGLYPKFKATGNLTYRNGPFTAFVQGRLIGSGKRLRLFGSTPAEEGVNIADNSVPAVVYVDARLAYEFQIGGSTLEVFVSATNLLDKDPPVTGAYAGGLAPWANQVNTGLFDVLGQRFTLGAKFKL